MDTTLVNLAALAVLGLIALYVGQALFANLRNAVLVHRWADAECGLLREKVERIQAGREFDRASNELSWAGFRKFRVADKQEEVSGVCSFYLHPHDDRPLPPFKPGQYLTFKLEIPSSAKSVVRCYSLSDAPKSERFRVSIKRSPPPREADKADVGRSVSNFFHDRVQSGDILDVQAPNGDFVLDLADQTPVVLIGGGIGITPVLSMLNGIIDSGSQRETWFLVGVRSSEDHVFKQHIETLAREHDNVHLHVCYSDPLESDREGKDYQHKGRVSLDLMKQLLPSNNYNFYFTGPPPMMNAIYAGLEEWGVADSRIHFEAFGPSTVKRVKEVHQPAAASPEAAAIEVEFARSEKTVHWDPGASSILEFAEANQIDLPCGCRAGSCGTCMLAVLSGDVEYLKQPNAQVEKGSCLTCIAVPKASLKLDA